MKKPFTLNQYFTDNMVFQSEKPMIFFGTCMKDITIQVKTDWETVMFQTTGEEFQIVLHSMHLSNQPFQVELSTLDYQVTLNNCLIGDVFVLCGQSNIEFATKQATHIDYETVPMLRIYTVPKLPFEDAHLEFPEYYHNQSSWQEANPSSIEWFSAIGYLMGKKLVQDLNIPIGLISCNYGDTSIFSWLNPKYLDKDEVGEIIFGYQSELDKYASKEEYNSAFHYQLPRLLGLYDAINKNIDAGIDAEKAHELAYEAFPNAVLPMGPKHYNRLGGCFETMLYKIGGINIKGVIYYQGEQDHNRVDFYAYGMKYLFKTFRVLFMDALLPIIYVQLPGYAYPGAKEGSIASLRLVQDSCQNLEERISMVSGIDCGEENNIHPKDKTKLGKRLANRVLEVIYGVQTNSFEPRVSNVFYRKSDLILSVSNESESLVVTGDLMKDFVIEKKHAFDNLVCEVKVVGGLIMITNAINITSVKYCCYPYVNPSIYNKEELPLLPFHLVIDHDNNRIQLMKK